MTSVHPTIQRGETHWSVAGRPTRIIVDLDRIAANVGYFRRLVTPGTDVMAVVKADGYGHGAVMVAQASLDSGATQLAVATVDEGVVLRSAGIPAPILVLGPVELTELTTALANRLTLTMSDPHFVGTVAKTARSLSPVDPVSVHVKIDSGMRRFGVLPEHVVSMFERIASMPELRVTGTYSHFADADGASDRFSSEQAGRFQACVQAIRDLGYSPGTVHISNSAATLRWRDFDYDMVRLGISLYGLSPSLEMSIPSDLAPALRLQAKIARVTTLAPGDCVSYGCTYIASTVERIGLVPIGYADGYRRGLSNRGIMTIDGVEAVVRGRVCMDQTVVNLPDAAQADVGSVVDVISQIPGGPNSVASIARRLGTIDYEVVTGLSRRIPRIYTKGQQVVAVQDLQTVSPLDHRESKALDLDR